MTTEVANYKEKHCCIPGIIIKLQRNAFKSVITIAIVDNCRLGMAFFIFCSKPSSGIGYVTSSLLPVSDSSGKANSFGQKSQNHLDLCVQSSRGGISR
jgi:hypothetical protein